VASIKNQQRPGQRLKLDLKSRPTQKLCLRAISSQHRPSFFVIGAGGKERSRSSIGLIPVKIKHGSQRNQQHRDLLPQNLLCTALVVLQPVKAGVIEPRLRYSAATPNQGAERSCRTDQGVFPSRTSPRAVQTRESLCNSQASTPRQSIRRSNRWVLSVGMRLGTICSNH